MATLDLPRVSILGGGWLGEPLTQALLEAGYPVRCSTASEERYAELVAQLGEQQVCQVQVAPDQVTGDWATLLQAEVLVINIPPLKGQPEKEQFAALLPLVEASPIQNVLLVSSTGVYRSTQGVVTEDDGAEDWAHKLYRSEQLWQGSTAVATTVVRLAGLIGGKRHPGRFFQRRGVIPHPDAPVNLIHQVDVIGLIRAVLAQGAWGKVYNGCADQHPTKAAFYPKGAKSIGLPAPALGEGGAGAYKIVSNAKAKAELGWSLEHPDLMVLLEDWR